MTIQVQAQPAAEPRRRPPVKPLTRGERWQRRGPLLPALIFAVILTQLPFIFTLFYSTQQYNLLRPEGRKFIGLSNYGKVFTDELFRNAVWNTVRLTVSVVFLCMILGTALAVLLDKKFIGRSIVRTLLITPFLVMPTAAALLWKTSLLNPVYGLVNWALSPFGVGQVDWLSEYPMLSVIIVTTWLWTPFFMLIILAGLQSQSPEILEAAKVDGATAWQSFRRVTLPHLRQFIELAVVLGSIFILQTFDVIFMMTQGGPGQATTNLPYFIYQQAFRAFDVGEAAAAGVIVVIATIAIATAALRLVSGLFKGEGELA
jgi:sorbitol/mannitol transport system permease protein